MKKNSKVYLRMYLSYIIVLLIPITLGAALYLYLLKATKQQANILDQNLLMMVQRENDQRIEEVSKLASYLAMDTTVQKVASVKANFHAEDQFMLYTLVKNLNNIYLSEKFVDDIFIYFNNNRTVSSIRGNMSVELYYDLYCSNEEYPLEKFKDYMEENHYADTLRLQKDQGGTSLLFSMTTFGSVYGKPSATVNISLNLLELKSCLESMKWNEQMKILIINSKDELISSTTGDFDESSLNYGELLEGSYENKTSFNQPYIISVRESEKIDWKYITIIPKSIIEKSAKDIQTFALIGLFCCIMTGFAFSYYLTKRNYNPLKAILNVFKAHSMEEVGDSKNVYHWLKNQSEQFFKEHMDNQRLLQDYQKNLKNYCLNTLLTYANDSRYIMKKLRKYEIKLDLDYFIVIIFKINIQKRSQPLSEAYSQENALQKFIVSNIFEEMVLEYYTIEMVELGEKVAAIVNLPKEDIQFEENIKELIENMEHHIEVHFGFSVVAMMGSVQKGVEGIHASYVEACEAGEYVKLLDTGLVVYHDIKNVQKKYDYPIDMELKIINAIKTGNSNAAGEYIIETFNRNLSGKVSLDICRCLTFDMVGTLLKGADAGGYHAFAEEAAFTEKFWRELPVEELKNRFLTLADQLCSRILSIQKEAENDHRLSTKIEEYIQETYDDPDLNISLTAQHFDITPAYLSAIYKRQTGGSLLDYINTVRITKAEELLNQEYSVVEASQLVGFRDSGTFIRVFKKKRGITPGQVKKKL